MARHETMVAGNRNCCIRSVMRPVPELSVARVMLVTVALLAAAMPASAQLTQRTLQYQGSTRTWFEHLPTGYDGSHPVALVVALHGYSDSGDQFAVTTGWAPVADAGGFIVVFSQWRAGRGRGFRLEQLCLRRQRAR